MAGGRLRRRRETPDLLARVAAGARLEAPLVPLSQGAMEAMEVAMEAQVPRWVPWVRQLAVGRRRAEWVLWGPLLLGQVPRAGGQAPLLRRG